MTGIVLTFNRCFLLIAMTLNVTSTLMTWARSARDCLECSLWLIKLLPA